MTSLLQADNISKSYGSLTIFTGISLVINKDEKMALIARNGEGKTTLLNILSGKDTADSGEITAIRDLKIGYLEQDPVLDDRLTVIDQVFASTGEVATTIREYEEAIKQRRSESYRQPDFPHGCIAGLGSGNKGKTDTYRTQHYRIQ
jgi:ABC transport system ATP-binding/permease protein